MKKHEDLLIGILFFTIIAFGIGMAIYAIIEVLL